MKRRFLQQGSTAASEYSAHSCPLARISQGHIGRRGTSARVACLDTCPAGVETTGHSLAWALHLITQHPGVEARVAAELDTLGCLATAERPHPRQLTQGDLCHLAYLSCAIKAGAPSCLLPLRPQWAHLLLRKHARCMLCSRMEGAGQHSHA